MSLAVVTGTATIQDPTGLHARPAVQLAKLAKTFLCSVEVAAAHDGDWVNAKSTHSLMKIKVRAGAALFIRASGEDAPTAVSAVVSLIARNFEAR